MISNGVIAAAIVSAVVNTVGWAVLSVLLIRKLKPSVSVYFIGAAAFFVSQMVLRIPLMQLLGTQQWYLDFTSGIVGKIIVGAFTAGLFEETARLICARCIIKPEKRGVINSFTFGLGHGVCEAIFIVGINMLVYAVYMTAMNNGTFAAMFYDVSDPAGPPEALTYQLDAIQAVMRSFTAGTIYLGIIERVFAVTYHIFASMMIFKGAREGKTLKFYLLMLGAHTLVNTTAVAIPNVNICECVLCVYSVFMGIWIFRSMKAEKTIE